MKAARPLVIATALVVLAVARCGGVPNKSAESAPDETAQESEDGDTGEGGAPGDADAAVADAGPVAPERPRPDPALVKKAVDQSGSAPGGTLETHGLRFEVVENGPRAGWAMALVNRGSERLRVTADPSLLTIEVAPPPDPKAKKWTKPKKPRICRLPPEIRKERAAPEFSIILRPGRGFVEAFDPRLYCLPEQGVSPFVAGAKVTARFGFSPKTKVSWKKGVRVEEPLPDQPPPFVAVVASRHERDEHEDEEENGQKHAADAGVAEADTLDAGAPDDSGITMEVVDAGASPEPVRGVKELTATPVELGTDYAPPPTEKIESLGIDLVQGSDAASRANATATFKLTNHEKIARRIYLRRELVSFQVTGPDGTITCDPQPDERAPDRSAFTMLNPGGSISLTSRLAELCPEDAFQRPGLYVVEGQLDAFAKGDEFGFEAFVGRLVSSRAVVVRVRSGTLPFPGPRVIQRVRIGTP